MPQRALLGVTVLICLGLAPAETRERPQRGGRGPAAAAEEGGVAVYFTPNGGALDAIAGRINGAKKSLDVQAYLLTTQQIAGPIASAHKRGVKVRVVMDNDKAGDQYSAATYLKNAGVDVRMDGEHKEAHNKVMLVDGKTILTGSFNFTRAAEENNAENLLVISDKPKLYAAYLKNFETHRAHAKPYAGPPASKPPKEPRRD